VDLEDRTVTPNEFDLSTESVICASPDRRYEVRVPAFPDECDYIRVTFNDGLTVGECVYWNYDEIQEDIEALGAVTGAIKAVFEGTFKPV
jgi:predicted DNA-binding protein (UPF0278 family)